MGIFYDQIEVFNRAPVPLSVRFDGQELTLPPGPGRLPSITIPFAMNQNPVMGSQDPNNPHWSGAQYLIGVVGKSDFPCEPLTKEEWEAHLGRPCRLDEVAIFEEKYSGDPKAKMVTRGQKDKPAARNRYEAGGAGKTLASFEKDR
jgi:hypothetical protein